MAVRGAGLVGQPVFGGAGWRGEASEDVSDLPGRGRGQHPLAFVMVLPEGMGQRALHPAVGDGGVKLHHIFQRHTDAAQGHGEAGLAGGQGEMHLGAVHRLQQFGGAQRLGQGDDGQVQRQLQRLAHADRATELAVEILRTVAVEIGRFVVDQGFGMGEAFVKGEAVNQRLSGSNRASEGRGHVDKTLPLVGVVGGGPDGGEDFAVGVIGDHDGDLQAVALAADGIGGEAFEADL